MIVKTVAFIVIICSGTCYAQNSLNVAGGEMKENNGAISYSIGQLTTNVVVGAGKEISLSTGIQLVFTISNSTNNINELDDNYQIVVFPNPTNELLILSIANLENENFEYQLMDMNGKLNASSRITSEQTKIDMLKLPSANYCLDIYVADRKVKSFKILKNK
jgi:hypothetical protein